MQTPRPSLALLTVAAALASTLLLAGCQKKHEPVKPTVTVKANGH